MGVVREAFRVGGQLGAPRGGDLIVNADYAFAGAQLTLALANLGRSEEAYRAGEEALAVADQVLGQRPQYGWALGAKQTAEHALVTAALEQLDPAEALQFAAQQEQAALALVGIEPGNVAYANVLGIAYGDVGDSMRAAGRWREALANYRQAIEILGRAGERGGGLSPAVNITDAMADTAALQAQLGDSVGAAATIAAADGFMSPSTLQKSGLAGSYVVEFFDALRAYSAAAARYEQDDFAAARLGAHNGLAPLRVLRSHGAVETRLSNDALCRLSDLEGRADYALGAFAAAAQAESSALPACKALYLIDIAARRASAQVTTWLSMALAREGERQEAAQTIAPVVTMYRALAARNHGDQWLPLDYAGALYAQALSDPGQRAALLRQASGLVDHLAPEIAQLHDTREWRARIEAAQRRGGAISRAEGPLAP